MEESIILELLKQYQKQYRIALELERITKELEQAVRSNDQVSIRLILDMRQQSITQMQDSRCAAAVFLDQLSVPERYYIEELLKASGGEESADRLEDQLRKTSHNIRSALRKTIETDRRINMKIAEKKSFYYETEGDHSRTDR